WTSSREVFRELGKAVTEFAPVDWDKAAPPDRETPGINPLPTAADGRPPGYREFGAPRVRGI
ncbi:MAG TPA: ferredoxin, partial [Archangium sp.]